MSYNCVNGHHVHTHVLQYGVWFVTPDKKWKVVIYFAYTFHFVH